jgi:basic amino acid/polyamine antiporter, APA family
MPEAQLPKKLSLFDVTNLVVGAIIGADIYVASSFGAGYLGPFSLLVWVFAGLIAIVIALCFSQCASMIPKVGGPYAYAKEAWGQFAGFTVGWSLWFAEWISLAVFPLAFTRYLMFFFPNMDFATQVLVKGLFVAFLAVTNIVGVRAAGKINDILTIAKLAPLIFFTVAGLSWMALNPSLTAANFTPFSPFGFSNFGTALVLIFWAYAGFEISTIPSKEITEPRKTIPKAIIIGISIVTVFYLATNAVLFGVRNWSTLATDTAPLASATNSILASTGVLALVGAAIVGVGALISVAGSDESGMIGTSRLGYALAADGLFPAVFARIHKKYQTPYLSIIIQSITALVASIVGSLGLLISVSVFFLSIAYLATSASIFTFHKRGLTPNHSSKKHLIIPALGIAFSVYLISQCTPTQIAVGALMLLVGVPVYIKYSPKKELIEAKNTLLSRQATLKRIYHQEQLFLAHFILHIKEAYRKATKKSKNKQADLQKLSADHYLPVFNFHFIYGFRKCCRST